MYRPMTWANILTLMRAIAIVPLVYALIAMAWKTALGICLCAAATDILDGWCARWLQEETVYGQCMDPIVDKVLVIGSYVVLASMPYRALLPHWFVWLIVGKELVLVASGIYVWHCGMQEALKPSWLGKLGMLSHIGFMTWLLMALAASWSIQTYVSYGSYIVAAVSMLALVQYGYRAFMQRMSA